VVHPDAYEPCDESDFENTMFEILLLIVIVVCLFGLIGKRSHPAHMKGLRAILARQCPSCRTPIPHNASYCPHCTQATGFGRPRVGVFDMECAHCHRVVNRFRPHACIKEFSQ
jgi:hypothetical protein